MSATNRGAVRDPLDFYGTPAWATEAFMRRFVGNGWDNHPYDQVLEPAAGTGAILKVLIDHGFNGVCGYEIDHARAERASLVPGVRAVGECDYLTDELQGWDLIITNPPFSLALEFVEKALRDIRDGGCVVMLLPLNFMSSKGRVDFHRKHPAHVHVLPKRPSFGLNKHGKPGTDAQDYAWFQWGGPGYVPGKWEILSV